MIDLHTHSNASDGSFSPSGLMEEAARRRISAIALTDHDTVGGLEEAAEAARKLDIRFIPGIELQILRDDKTAGTDAASGGEFHLLGLDITRPSTGFYAAVEELKRRRENRNLEIVDRMNKSGIDISYKEIRALAGGHSIGRPHFAAYLVQRKIVKTPEQAFVQFLGKGKPFFIPKAGLEFETATTAIRESGGISVLAHPMSLFLSWGWLPVTIKNLKERGLDGLEAWHPTATPASCLRLEELGKRLGLIITAGSDFHGEVRPDRKLGVTAGGKEIDNSFLEGLERL